MAEQWYYSRQGQRLGPLTTQQLRDLAARGELGPTDLVWREGMTRWSPAGQVAEIFLPAAVADLSGVLTVTGRWLTLAGAGVLLVAFFVPWWGLKFQAPASLRSSKSRESEEEIWGEVSKAMLGNVGWYLSQSMLLGADASIEWKPDNPEPQGASLWLWGWNLPLGVAGFFIGFLLLSLGLATMLVKPLVQYGWIGSLVAVCLGVMLLPLTLAWIITSPGKDVPPLLSQGIILGPWLALVGDLLLVGGGLLAGLPGLAACNAQFAKAQENKGAKSEPIGSHQR